MLLKALLLIQYVIKEREKLKAGYIGSGIIVVLVLKLAIIGLESPAMRKTAISLMNIDLIQILLK